MLMKVCVDAESVKKCLEKVDAYVAVAASDVLVDFSLEVMVLWA